MSKVLKYKGRFEAYHEQGMGGFCATFHDDRGLHKVEGLEHIQHSMDWLIWFADVYKKGDQYPLEGSIFDRDLRLFYEGPLTLRPTKFLRNIPEELKTLENKCRLLDYYFVELGFDKSCKAIHGEYVVVLDTPFKVKALREKKDEDE